MSLLDYFVSAKEADTDGSGTLDIDEFKTVVKTCLGVRGRVRI